MTWEKGMKMGLAGSAVCLLVMGVPAYGEWTNVTAHHRDDPSYPAPYNVWRGTAKVREIRTFTADSQAHDKFISPPHTAVTLSLALPNECGAKPLLLGGPFFWWSAHGFWGERMFAKALLAIEHGLKVNVTITDERAGNEGCVIMGLGVEAKESSKRDLIE